MFRLIGSLGFALLIIVVAGASAAAQQIVSDPALDARLVAFEQQFPQFVAARPQLTAGAAGPIRVDGKRGKVSVAYSFEGAYTIQYGALDLAPTSPISADRFRLTLDVTSIVLFGSGELAITRKGETYELSCPNNAITVPAMTFTSGVVVTSGGSVRLEMPRTDLDPRAIDVSVPCLEGRANATAEVSGLEAELAHEVTLLLSAGSTGVPSRGTLKKASAGITSAAAEPDSDVADTAEDTAEATAAAVAAGAASPCDGVVHADVEAVVADLAAIASQAAEAGFPEAVSAFADDLRVIVPSLTAPSQDAVETFLDDLEDAVDESGPGGSAITPLEESTLTLELYAVVLSTGITAEDLATLHVDLVAAVATIEGISTDQLEADLRSLVADASGCLEE